MNKKPIGELADIMVGLVLKRKEAGIADNARFHYMALTLRCLNSEGWIDEAYLDEFESSEKLDSRYLTLEGDIVVKMTTPYTAVAINKDTSGCVVPAQFIIVRVKEKVVPGYIALYLNTDKIRKHIALSATGMTVPMLKTGTIKDLEIPLLEYDRQLKIAEVGRLMVEERHLLTKLVNTKEKYNQALIEALIKED